MASSQSSSKDTLEQALEAFKAELPQQYQKDLEAAAATNDDYHSVMHLTTKLDLATSKRRGESFAPRLLPFLYRVKDYASVLDTIAQSHFLAAVVWGSVKLCLILTSNWAEYFEAVTRVLNRVGTISSTFSEFGSLFPSSERLQDALNNYYAVVIRMCCKAVHDYKRPDWKQIPKKAFKSFDRDYGPFQRELEHCATVVKDEIDLASESRNQKDSAENALTLRNLDTKLDTQHGWQLVKARLKVKSNLSKSDVRAAWRHVRRQCIPGTSSWFEKGPSFATWRDDTESSTLVYSDRIGSGKTIVSANVIAALIQSEGTRYRVGYCLCQMLDTSARNARNVLGCIARQLLDQVIDTSTSSTLLDLLEKSSSGDTDTITRLLNKYLPKDRQTFIVLDGMDELEHDDNLRILRAVAELVHFGGRPVPLKIFITSRSEPGKLLEVLDTRSYQLRPSKKDLAESFNEFIIATLYKKVETGQLNVSRFRSTDMILAIMHAVQQGSQSMALWAKLLIERLCLMNNERDVLEALEDTKVPIGLAEIYNKILSRLETNTEQRSQLIRILIWTIGAMRVMTTGEMQEAIAVEHGTSELDDRAIPDMPRLVHATGGLVYLDTDDETVHLVHASLATHLFARQGTPTLQEDKEGSTFCFHPNDINAELTKICATYLNFSEFKRSLVHKESAPQGLNPRRRLTMQFDEHGKTVSMVANVLQKLREFGKTPHEESSRQLDTAWQRIQNARRDESSLWHPELLSYASYYWVHHGAVLDPTEDTGAYKEFKHIVASNDQHISKAWDEAYGAIESLEARALSTASHCPSDYFNTSRFSQSTLKLIKWSFANNNPALLGTARASSDAKLGQHKDLSYTNIANLLSTIMNLMMSTSMREVMSKALRDVFMTIDPESSHTRVAAWYAASLFNEPQHQVAPPSGWRHWSTTSEYLEDIFSIPHFEPPQLTLSHTGNRNKLGNFHKHPNWKSFTDILVHPLTLAAVLDHLKALTWIQGALDVEDRTDPFDAAIDPFDLLLDALYFAVLSARRECCDLLQKTMKQDKAPSLRGNKARLVRIARTIMWAQLRGYQDVARRLLDITLPVYGRGILDEAIRCTDDADNSLLFYLLELQDFDMLARLLVTLEGAKLSKPPTTATSNTLVDYARAFMEESNLKNDQMAVAALHAIEALEERPFSFTSHDGTKERGNTMTELKRRLTHSSVTSASEDEDCRHSQRADELLEKLDSPDSLDLPKQDDMTALQQPPSGQQLTHSEPQPQNVNENIADAGRFSAESPEVAQSVEARFSGLSTMNQEEASEGSSGQQAHKGLGIIANGTYDAVQNFACEEAGHHEHSRIDDDAPGMNTGGSDSAIGTLEKPPLPTPASQQECLHASPGAEELEARLNGGSPQPKSDSPKMQRRCPTVDRDA